MTKDDKNSNSKTCIEVFDINDIPTNKRDSNIYFEKYCHLDGDWVEKDENLCEVRNFSQIPSGILKKSSSYIRSILTSGITIKSKNSGVLEFTLEQGDSLNKDSILCKLHPKGHYLNENIPENTEYKEFFKGHSQNNSFNTWLVQDGTYVKVGESIFQYIDSNGEPHKNKSKKEGFVHQIYSNSIHSLIQNELMYIIRESDEKRIEQLFENLPEIINDEFTNSTNINWSKVSAVKQYQGIITKSDDTNTDFLFSFNFINGRDHIVFHFNPKQIRPKQFDKVNFLFENGEQILYELVTNPVQSKNIMNESILEYKSIITSSELQLFTASNFKKWKISLVSDKKEILGGDINGDLTKYKGKKNIEIAIKKFANDYIKLVKNTISDYQPTILAQNKEHKDPSTDFCFVYLMHDTSNNYYKIGISNNPEYRESTLQSEKPTIEMIISKKFPIRKIAESFEKALHESYSQKRLRGEWFNLNSIDVEHIKETLS